MSAASGSTSREYLAGYTQPIDTSQSTISFPNTGLSHPNPGKFVSMQYPEQTSGYNLPNADPYASASQSSYNPYAQDTLTVPDQRVRSIARPKSPNPLALHPPLPRSDDTVIVTTGTTQVPQPLPIESSPPGSIQVTNPLQTEAEKDEDKVLTYAEKKIVNFIKYLIDYTIDNKTKWEEKLKNITKTTRSKRTEEERRKEKEKKEREEKEKRERESKERERTEREREEREREKEERERRERERETDRETE